jgi:UDP-2,3-diacylglucosamine pyrophosphatase LpxH
MTAVKKVTKRIFISDIHMGDKRSAINADPPPPYAYGWFTPKEGPNHNHPEMLADFLKNYILIDDSVAEVIILGDLFDEWVVPANKNPFEFPGESQFEAIAGAPQNIPAVDMLKKLAEKGKLTYLTGNHDFLGTIEPGEDTIKKILPGVKYIGSQGVGAYKTGDGILAEHGHRFALFNAPWIKDGKGSGLAASWLPFGFYITRLNVQYEAEKGKGYGFFEFIQDAIIKKYTTAFIEGNIRSIAKEIDKLIIDTFEVFHADEIFAGQDGIKMDGLNGVPGTVKWAEIEKHFARIYSDWEKMHPDNGSAFHALINNLFKLKSAVEFVLKNEKPKILLFGHTHHWKFETREYGNGPQIYANTGAWINKRDCTFIRTEFDHSSKEHSVGVWRYKDEKINLLEFGAVKI